MSRGYFKILQAYIKPDQILQTYIKVNKLAA